MQGRNKLQLGLIGYGYWGPSIARTIETLPDCRLKYCADINDNALKLIEISHPSTIVTRNYLDMLQDKKISAVFIATPAKTHFFIIKECLLAHKHVFVEKPFVDNIEEASKLINLANEKKLILMVGHVYLYNSCVQKIKELIRSKNFGKIRYLFFQRRNKGPVRQDVDVVWDLGPHDVSMVLYLLDQKPLSVSACGECYLQTDRYDVVSVNIKFKDNVMVNIFLSWIDPVKIREAFILGDNQAILFDDTKTTNQVKLITNINKPIVKLKNLNVDYKQLHKLAHPVRITFPMINNTEPLKIEIQHFVDCISSGQKPISDAMNGLATVEIISAIEQSLLSNSKLIKLK